MKQEDKNNEFKKIMSRIKGHVEQVFNVYNKEVEKRNDDQIGGILHKNDKSEKIYSDLQNIAKELSKNTLNQKMSKNKCISATNYESKGEISFLARLLSSWLQSIISLKTKTSR